MSETAVFQQDFGAALATRNRGAGDDPAIARALTVHRNTSAKAAQDALAANYPVVRALVGDEAFAACAAAFVEAIPPREPRLCLYGAWFDMFLAAYDPFADYAYLPDIAALERLHIEALFAADAESFDGAVFDLAQNLPLHPAARIMRFATPAIALWHAHQDDAAPDALDNIIWEPCIALVTRPFGRVLITPIDEPTATMVTACAGGEPLGEAAAAALAAGGDVTTIFATLIRVGALCPAPKQGDFE